MNVQYKRALYTMVLFGLLFVYLLIDYVVAGVDGFLEGLTRLADYGLELEYLWL